MQSSARELELEFELELGRDGHVISLVALTPGRSWPRDRLHLYLNHQSLA